MHYFGSKKSSLAFIRAGVASVLGRSLETGGKFADFFSGTCVVGESFRKSGWNVIVNDVQRYGYFIGRGRIGTDAKAKEAADKFIPALNAVSKIDGYFYKNYCAGSGSGRLFFSDENGRKLDAILALLNALRLADVIDHDSYGYALTCVLEGADRVANVASQYAAHLKTLKFSASKPLEIKPLEIADGPVGEAFCMEANALADFVCGDVAYLDPPYNGRRYDVYYHLLETIARGDEPKVYGKGGLRPVDAFRSTGFYSKKTAAKSLDELLRKLKFECVFLSYNDEGLITFDEIETIMKKYGTVEKFTLVRDKFKSNKNVRRPRVEERLYCLIR